MIERKLLWTCEIEWRTTNEEWRQQDNIHTLSCQRDKQYKNEYSNKKSFSKLRTFKERTKWGATRKNKSNTGTIVGNWTSLESIIRACCIRRAEIMKLSSIGMLRVSKYKFSYIHFQHFVNNYDLTLFINNIITSLYKRLKRKNYEILY